MSSSADPSKELIRSTDNTMAAFLTFLAEEQVSARTFGCTSAISVVSPPGYKSNIRPITPMRLATICASTVLASPIDRSPHRSTPPWQHCSVFIVGSRHRLRQS